MRSRGRSEIDAVLRKDLYAFIQRCFFTLKPGATFMANWHLEALVFHLDLVRTGKIRRLMINLPPRHLKSLIVSVALPAFLLGHDPHASGDCRLIWRGLGREAFQWFSHDFELRLVQEHVSRHAHLSGK